MFDNLPDYAANVGNSLRTPSTASWPQLAAVVVFVLIVTFAWRQVVNYTV